MTLCKVNNSAAFSLFTVLYEHPFYPRHFDPQRPLCTLAATPFLPTPPAINLLSVSCGFVWTFPVNEPNTTWPLLSGIFPRYHVFRVHPRCSLCQRFIPFVASMPLWIDGPQLFIYCSSVGGHLGCSTLTLMNRAAVSFCVPVSV